MISVTFHTGEFNRAINELVKNSRRIDTDVITSQAQSLLRKLAWNTPKTVEKKDKMRGRARAGWVPAWKALKIKGTPYVGNAKLASSTEGGFIDGRKKLGRPFFTMINRVPYIKTLDKQHSILDKSLTGRVADLEKALDKQYAREMRRRSG